MLIYKITNKINGKIYIGQTRQSLAQRWSKHCKQKKTNYMYSAIHKYGRENFTIEEIDRASSEQELNEKEIYWISFYNSTNREIGYNIKEGGNQCSCPEETRLKIGEANAGRKPSELAIQNSVNSRKGKKLSDQTRQKMSESRIGHTVSEETRQVLKSKLTGKKRTPEQIERIRQGQLGRKQTEEHKEAIRQGNLGKKRTPEMIEKMKGRVKTLEEIEKIRAKNLGRKNSEETRQKMREAFTGGRTGHKNSLEAIRKSSEMRKFRNFLKWKIGETIQEYKDRTGFDAPIKFNEITGQTEAGEYTLEEARKLLQYKRNLAAGSKNDGWE